jgi:plastocyanin
MSVARWVAVCAAVLGAACSEDDGLSPPPGPPVSSATITILDNSFGPQTVLLTVGGTVTWEWNPNNVNPHSVVFSSAAGAPGGHPTAKATGTPYAGTFAQAGTFNFHCSVHGGLVGAIFVQSGLGIGA